MDYLLALCALTGCDAASKASTELGALNAI